MADVNVREIVKMGIDGYRNRLATYSVKESQDTIRDALIDANNGSTVLDWRAVRDGKCVGLFSIVEEVLGTTVIDGLQENDFFMTLVDYRNVAEGDQNKFLIEDSVLFTVDKVSDGNQAVGRQRISGVSEISIPTVMHMVRIYEELNRVLAGRVDFNEMIQKVSKSYQQQILSDIYALYANATAADFGGAVYFPAAGSYSADTLLTLIDHVEAAAGGKPATIYSTKKGLRKAVEIIQSDQAKEELHNFGYYGKFYGTPCVALPQRHQTGTTTFMFGDEMLIIAGDEKPFKFVYEGNPIVLMGDPMTNADLTQEFLYGSKYGLGIVTAGNTGIGRYETT